MTSALYFVHFHEALSLMTRNMQYNLKRSLQNLSSPHHFVDCSSGTFLREVLVIDYNGRGAVEDSGSDGSVLHDGTRTRRAPSGRARRCASSPG
jgi:hypothetical protein